MRVQALYPIASVCVLVLSQTPAGSQPQNPMPVGKGLRLEALAWPEAERVLTPETVELRGVLDAGGIPLPMMEGHVTFVLKRTDGWLIEAYRYTLKLPAVAPTTPAPLPKRPGGDAG